jgi:tyrosyl-tRNA synthetase
MPTTEVARERLEAGMDLVEALVLTRLARSRSAAKAQIQAGGVYVNGQRAARADHRLSPSDLTDGQVLLRRGKKEYRRMVVSEVPSPKSQVPSAD